MMSSTKFYSQTVTTQYDGNSGAAYAKRIDVDFDVEFNLPTTISGNCVINIPWAIMCGASSDNIYGYVVVNISHYDGTTETLLVTNTGTEYYKTGATPSAYYYQMSAIDLDIPLKHFKKGETLRCTIELWAKNTDGHTHTWFIGHDPMNRATTPSEINARTFGTEPSIATFQMPVRIDS
jgi:hypothetical protein